MQARWAVRLLAVSMLFVSVMGVSAETIKDEIMFEGRFVRLIFPPDFDGNDDVSVPLVLHLHGAVPSMFPNPADLELIGSGYDEISSKFNVIVAAPTAMPHPTFPIYLWNITEDCCSFPPGTAPDDADFLNRLVKELVHTLPIDPKRIYLYGYSAGAAMAYRLACDNPYRFAALVSGAGAFPVHDPKRCSPPVPISILEFRSKDDAVIPFEGGTLPQTAIGLKYPGAIETVVRWAVFNKCNGVLNFGTEPTLDLDSDVPDKETTVNQVEGCPEGVNVELWSMEGVTHEPFTFSGSLAEETLAFLLQHSRKKSEP